MMKTADEVPNWSGWSNVAKGSTIVVGVDEITDPLGIPKTFALSQNYPNPFNSTTLIRYAIPDREGRPHRTTLKIYNIAGQKVRTLVDKRQAPGYYSVAWHGRDGLGKEVSSGIYFYRLQAGSYTEIKKMVFLK